MFKKHSILTLIIFGILLILSIIMLLYFRLNNREVIQNETMGTFSGDLNQLNEIKDSIEKLPLENNLDINNF